MIDEVARGRRRDKETARRMLANRMTVGRCRIDGTIMSYLCGAIVNHTLETVWCGMLSWLHRVSETADWCPASLGLVRHNFPFIYTARKAAVNRRSRSDRPRYHAHTRWLRRSVNSASPRLAVLAAWQLMMSRWKPTTTASNPHRIPEYIIVPKGGMWKMVERQTAPRNLQNTVGVKYCIAFGERFFGTRVLPSETVCIVICSHRQIVRTPKWPNHSQFLLILPISDRGLDCNGRSLCAVLALCAALKE